MTTISANSKATVTRLVRKEFDSIDFSSEYIHNKADKLIQAASDFGLLELAIELQTDKLIETQ
jgi:hypothetical protein